MVVSAVAVGRGAGSCLGLGFLKADPELRMVFLEGDPGKHQQRRDGKGNGTNFRGMQ